MVVGTKRKGKLPITLSLKEGFGPRSRSTTVVAVVVSLWFLALVFSAALIDDQFNSKTSDIIHLRSRDIASLHPYAITQCHRALWHTLETTTIGEFQTIFYRIYNGFVCTYDTHLIRKYHMLCNVNSSP